MPKEEICQSESNLGFKREKLLLFIEATFCISELLVNMC